MIRPMPQHAPPVDACCCIAIRKVARHLTQHYDRCLAPVALTVTQFSILSHLVNDGQLTINDLATRLAMDRTSLGRTLRPLERAGLLSIAADERDGRRRELSLTADGRARLAAARPLWRDAQARFDAAFGSQPSRQLRSMLAEILATDLAPESHA